MTDLEAKQLRVGIVGASCTGKTCMVKRFVENSFHGSQYNPTLGVDFFSRRMNVKTIGTVTFVIVDIGSNALNSKMLQIYLHGIDIFFLAYDMTNASSLNELRKWISLIPAFSGNTQNITNSVQPSIAFIGCKGDLEHLRAVRLDAHTRFAQEYNIPLSFLASAKSGESVITCFCKSAAYHLNPDAKQRVREYALLQASIAPSKRASFTGPVLHNHPVLLPPGRQAAGISAGPSTDPNSTVCTIQ